MKKDDIFKINLQLFAEGDEEENTNEPNIDEQNTNTPEPEATDDEEDDETVLLKKKLKVLEQEQSLNLNKVNSMETELANATNSINELKGLLTRLVDATQQKPKKKPVNAEEAQDVTSKEILLHQISKLESQMKNRDEQDFIKSQIAEKPWVADAVKKAKIQTKDDYIRLVMPLEEDLKEKDELKKRLSATEDSDLLSDYGIGFGRASNDSKAVKISEQAKALGASLIDEIMR